MIWPDWKIREWAEDGGITPYDPDMVNPASIDLKLGNTYRRPSEFRDNEWGDPTEFDTIYAYPGDLLLCHSLEFTRIPPGAAAFLFLKSSTGRKGLEHLHAGFGDPGFCGEWTFELYNCWPMGRLKLEAGKPLLQLVIMDLCGRPEKDYTKTGHYCNQVGPTRPWEHGGNGND